MARKMEGKEKKAVVSVRVEPWKRKLVFKKYKTFQQFVDDKLNEEFEAPHEAVIVKRETISVDDF